jgi:hypothetical protein
VQHFGAQQPALIRSGRLSMTLWIERLRMCGQSRTPCGWHGQQGRNSAAPHFRAEPPMVG